MKHYLFSIFLIFILTACIKQIDYNAVKKVQKVQNIESLQEHNITKNEEFQITLGDKHPEVILDDNQTVFASKYNLSTVNKAFSIKIKSSSQKGFFAPKLLFLSKDYTILKTVLAKDLRFDRGFFKGTIFINKNMKKIHYLIVTQDLNEIHKQYNTNSVQSTTLATGYFYYTYASGDIKSKLKNSNGGKIQLTIQIYNPKILKDIEKN